MWYKLENGRPVRFNGKYVVDEVNEKIYSNPIDEQMLLCGYRKLTYADPLEEKEGFCINTIYEETDTEIVVRQVYEEVIEDEFDNS